MEKTLYEKAEKAINQAFEATKKSVKLVSEKAEEAKIITKLLIEKVTLEHKVSKKFAELGNRVYEKALREGKSISLADSDLKSIIDETKALDSDLAQVEAALEAERNKK
jgi:hypothetical protein